MRELMEDTFSENKNKDAHDHVDRVLSILKDGWINSLQEMSKLGTSLKRPLPKGVNTPRSDEDRLKLMELMVFLMKKGVCDEFGLNAARLSKFQLSGKYAAKEFEQIIDFLSRSYINHALTVNPHVYISCIKQFWNIAMVKRSGDVTRVKDPLSKGPPQHPQLQGRKRRIIIPRLGTGPIPRMTPTKALTAIQTLADYSQKWHDGTSSRNMSNSSDIDGLVAVISKLDNLERDMKKLRENVDDVKYGKFGHPAPFNRSSRAKFHVEVQESYEEIVYRCSLIAQEMNGELRSNLTSVRKLFTGLGRLVRQLGTKFLEIIGEKDLRTNTMTTKIRESKEKEILGTIINKLHDEWFNGTDEDDDDLEGIVDYLEPTLLIRMTKNAGKGSAD
nr:hypothetical protein [Tanacetum cinerariifolium]